MKRLEKEELRQYQRQIILPELGMEGQQKLKNAKILMVGAGGLGCPALQYLVAAGVGTIGIVDDDVVEQSNLHRQILYTADDIGKLKAETAKLKLSALNPFVELVAYSERLTSSNAAALMEGYDLILDGSDNFLTRYLVNDTCVALNKPLVFGSILKFEGQVSVFNYLNGPNYRDIFPESTEGQEAPNCSEIGVIGILPGIIGLYMANEAIKICGEFGKTLSGKLMTYNALDNQVNIFTVMKAVNSLPGKETVIDLDPKVNHVKSDDLSAGYSKEDNLKDDDLSVDELKVNESKSEHLKEEELRADEFVTDIKRDNLKNEDLKNKENKRSEQVGEISVEQLMEWLEQTPEEICLVDVRETFEYEDHNIGGLNIPLYELSERLNEIPSDKKLIICCQTGQRSKIAVNLLKPVYKGPLFHLKNGI